MEKESSGQRSVEANSTGGQGSRRAVASRDTYDDDDDDTSTLPCFYGVIHSQCSVLWGRNMDDDEERRASSVSL
jgi:hypothetical protein